jgi:hypothetical protein
VVFFTSQKRQPTIAPLHHHNRSTISEVRGWRQICRRDGFSETRMARRQNYCRFTSLGVSHSQKGKRQARPATTRTEPGSLRNIEQHTKALYCCSGWIDVTDMNAPFGMPPSDADCPLRPKSGAAHVGRPASRSRKRPFSAVWRRLLCAHPRHPDGLVDAPEADKLTKPGWRPRCNGRLLG